MALAWSILCRSETAQPAGTWSAMLRTQYRRPHLEESYTVLASQVVHVNNSKDWGLWRKALRLVGERFGESDPRHTPISQIF